MSLMNRALCGPFLGAHLALTLVHKPRQQDGVRGAGALRGGGGQGSSLVLKVPC